MIEVYLFINPLGGICLDAEKKILKLVTKEKKKVQFRIIPLVNLQTVQMMMHQEAQTSNKKQEYNHVFETIYSASLDYKALQLQGNRMGRIFLFKLQEAVAINKRKYSPELVQEIIQTIGADEHMFQLDRASDFVKDSFASDQRIANEMGIKMHPSAVVFNYSCNRDFGVLVEDCSSLEVIEDLFKTDSDSCQLHFDEQKTGIHRERLHLI